jgi:hypothetical protein
MSVAVLAGGAAVPDARVGGDGEGVPGERVDGGAAPGLKRQG